MGGGLMQLVAYGAQDVYLTTDPEITFFRAVYRKHTNFAIESIDQVFNGSVSRNSKVTATISRNGDLITNMYLQVKLPGTSNVRAEINNLGHAMINEVELEIGGQRIDRQYGEWLDIWSELSMPDSKKKAYDAHMINKYPDNQTYSKFNDERYLYVPLQFFFNRNPGLALPLIALQYHEVKINITFGSLLPTDADVNLYVDYVYLDTDERKRFAQSAHEMLIEQVQFTGDESVRSGTNSYRLNFNHPVKELVWVVTDGNKRGVADEDKLTFKDAVLNASLQLNGHDRFDQRPSSYFRLVQPFQHHTRIPEKPVFVYSFAIKPEDHQPSGTCNFSRIDNATLKLDLKSVYDDTTNPDGPDANNDKLKIFAVSVNVLRIMSGMGGLAYSN